MTASEHKMFAYLSMQYQEYNQPFKIEKESVFEVREYNITTIVVVDLKSQICVNSG